MFTGSEWCIPDITIIDIPVACSTPPDAETTDFLKKFHGHVCPGSLMGLRLAIAEKEALG